MINRNGSRKRSVIRIHARRRSAVAGISLTAVSATSIKLALIVPVEKRDTFLQRIAAMLTRRRLLAELAEKLTLASASSKSSLRE